MMQNNMMENSQHTLKIPTKFSIIYVCHILFHKDYAVTYYYKWENMNRNVNKNKLNQKTKAILKKKHKWGREALAQTL